MKKRMIAMILMTAMIAAFGLSGCGKTASPAQTPAEETTKETTIQPAEEKSRETAAQTAGEQPQETAAQTEEEAPVFEGAAYGYAGDDPVELAAYRYMAEEVSKDYDKADVCIPTVDIIAVDYTPETEVILYGDFWVLNYNIEGDTLKCVSGGNYPGVMHVAKDSNTVTAMDMVADGSDFDASAKELFGEHYDDFMAVYSDRDAMEELRRITVSDYVNMNGLAVTKYQDEGWDPVELYRQ